MEQWRAYIDELTAGLQGLIVTGAEGEPLAPGEAFIRWIALTREISLHGRSTYFIGNGASASIASHIAADALKNGKLRAFAFNDPALLTAVSNDLAYTEAFALPLSRLAQPGDLLVSISSSGNSPNIVRALETARELEIHIITLSGMNPENRSRSYGELNFYVPSPRYGWVECAHHAIVHYWLDQYLNRYGGGAN